MPMFKVEVHRTEYHRAVVEVEAESAEAAEQQVKEEGVDSDEFECVNADEEVASVTPA
jgi:hypothetical protein